RRRWVGGGDPAGDGARRRRSAHWPGGVAAVRAAADSIAGPGTAARPLLLDSSAGIQPRATRVDPPRLMAQPSGAPRRAICDRCGARGWLRPGEQRICGECGGQYRPMALLEGLVDRWFAPPAQHVSEFYPRHLKLIELMWTTEGRGREMYLALGLEKVSYSQFLTRATRLVVRGLEEGWIVADLRAAPTPDDRADQIRFVDADRWADALTTEFV